MSFDLYADLASQAQVPAGGPLPGGLASGFVDGSASWSTKGNFEKNEARLHYLQFATGTFELPSALLHLEPQFDTFPDNSWIAFEVEFTLQSPWYSKDDRPFHVLDNPVRKDHVFGVPHMSATSWKGLLRWACRMQAGLLGYLANHDGKFDDWHDCPWIVHLFGNEKGEKKHFQQGALVFYPTWFSKIGFEVINPHSRTSRSGTQPIYYEVVPADTPGMLRLLYAPLPGAARPTGVKPEEAIERMLDAVENLLTTYGISAKRTAGWGTASVDSWTARRQGQPPIHEPSLVDLTTKLKPWVNRAMAEHD